jgi:hypothetical protein
MPSLRYNRRVVVFPARVPMAARIDLQNADFSTD